MARMAETVAETAPGFYLIESDHGFVVHINASAERLRLVRDLAGKRLTAAGVNTETAEGAQLVASELIGNAVRSCGDLVPLVVEVDAVDELGVWVKVHDPDAGHLPRRSGARMDDAEAESGRGLPLVDVLAPGWEVTVTPVGKQIRARLPHQGRNCA